LESIKFRNLDLDGDIDAVIDITGNTGTLFVFENQNETNLIHLNLNLPRQPTKLYRLEDMNGDGGLDRVGSFYKFSINAA